MLGPIYKLVCIAIGTIGLVVALPMALFAGIMAIANFANGGWFMLLAIVAALGGTVVCIVRTVLRFKSGPSSFMAPTFAGAIGLVLIYVGLPFALHPPVL